MFQERFGPCQKSKCSVVRLAALLAGVGGWQVAAGVKLLASPFPPQLPAKAAEKAADEASLYISAFE